MLAKSPLLLTNKPPSFLKSFSRPISYFFYSTNDTTAPKGSQIHKICLTGGPCAGKTTALTHLQHVLSQKGFRVFSVPEAATLLMKGGAMINTSILSFNQGVKF